MLKLINFLSIITNNKEILVTISGWIIAVLQFVFIFYTNRKEKKRERKIEAYNNYMIKVDKIMHNVSNDPNQIMESYNDFYKEALNNAGNEEAINISLMKYNEKLKDIIINATEPMMIIRQELNQLKLISSNELLSKIIEMDKLIIDYSNAVQKSIGASIPNNINSTVNELQILTQDERWRSFEKLNNDILYIMRKEVGN